MKKIVSALLTLVLIVSLTGCVQKKSSSLNDQNSRYVQGGGSFEVRLPSGVEMEEEQSEGSSKLYKLVDESRDPSTVARIEESPANLEQAIDLLVATDGIEERGREILVTPYFRATELLVQFVEAGENRVPFYFIESQEMKRTYIFSYFEARPWEDMIGMIKSFRLLDQAEEVDGDSSESEDVDGVEENQDE